MKKTKEIILAILALVAMIPAAAGAQQLNDKLLNRPYADLRRWHRGFSIGVHTHDMRFTHNGFVTDTGEQWFMDQPSFSPGFCVNGLVDFRLNEYFSLRLSPGLYFGNREIKMVEPVMGLSEKQNLRSVFVVAPIDVKYSAQRYRNLRPYLTAGVMPALDVSKKRSDFLKLKSTDVYLTVGLGCDFYLPFFKLNPEIKFCFGLTDVIQHDRPDLVDDPERLKITQSLKKATSQMVVLTFYFE